jgi:Sec34-like family
MFDEWYAQSSYVESATPTSTPQKPAKPVHVRLLFPSVTLTL